MKKIFVTLASVALVAGMLCAQDINEATELYNNAATTLSDGDKTAALESFNKALDMAKALGADGETLVANCQEIIPKVSLSIAKDLVKEARYDEAIAKLTDVIALAQEYNAAETLEDASALLPQVKMQKGNDLLKTNPAEAAAVYKEIVDADPANGVAALRLGAALNASGDADGAVAAFEQAAANGQEKNALKQLANLFLKKSSAALKTKNYAEAVESALKSNEYLANPQTLQIAGQASQLAGKSNDAIKYFTEYLEAAPTAKNAGQIAYTVGALYQQAKNNAKAKEFYQKALTDPKYGAEAKKLLDALK